MKEMKGPGGPFEKLGVYKQQKIMLASINEFASKGFTAASTDAIAGRAGVSKGAIFHYFGTKEKLYIVTAEYILDGYVDHMEKYLEKAPNDIFEMFQSMVFAGLDYLLGKNLSIYKLHGLISTLELGEEAHKNMREKIESRTGRLIEDYFKKVKKSRLKIDAPEVIRAIMWISDSLDREVLGLLTSKTTVDDIKNMYKKRMPLVAQMLRNGIYKYGK
jgi:AcrR family transcriptional regulator